LVNLKTKSAGDGYPRKAIEKPVLRFLGSRTFSHGLGQTEKDRDQPQHGRYTSNTGHRAGACHRSLTSHGASSPVSLPSANPGTSNMPNRAESIGEGRALGDYLAMQKVSSSLPVMSALVRQSW